MGNARKFAGSQFITLQSLKGRPSLHERIEFVTEEDGKYGQKLVVTFESGMRLSLNATSVGNLIRDIDTDFDNWVGREVTVRAGEVDFQNGKADAILSADRRDADTGADKDAGQAAGKAADADRGAVTGRQKARHGQRDRILTE